MKYPGWAFLLGAAIYGAGIVGYASEPLEAKAWFPQAYAVVLICHAMSGFASLGALAAWHGLERATAVAVGALSIAITSVSAWLSLWLAAAFPINLNDGSANAILLASTSISVVTMVAIVFHVRASLVDQHCR